MNKERYNKLTVYVLTDEQAEKQSFNYKYLVSNSYMSHTAFKTLSGFKFWLDNRNLTLAEELKDGESVKINGEYVKISLLHIDPILPDYSNSHNLKNWDKESFDSFGKSNNLKQSYLMDNGDWTTCYIYHGLDVNYSQSANPITAIYYLNPNCDRAVYNWREFYDGIPLNNPSVIN